jgi:site-specific DNA recombinase
VNGLIYTRVSSKEQAEKRTSLETQEVECQTLARRQGVLIPENHIFREEGESAKVVDRTELQKLLKFVRENRGKIDIVYIWKIDRLARNLGDYYGIKVALAKYDVKIVSVTEPIEDDPVGRFLEAILAAAAQFDNEIRTVRTITGMRAKVEKGEWPHQCPIGYKKVRGQVVIDEVYGPVIREMLNMFSTGNYTRRQISEYGFEHGIMTASGRKKTDDQIKSIVTNCIYAGLTHNKLSSLRPTKGRHRALVAEEIIKKNIEVIEGKKNSYIQRGDELFPLRGTLVCTRCKSKLTASSPKGNGGYYPTYHCNKSTCKKKVTGKRASVSVDQAHTDFRKILDDMKPLTEIVGLFKRFVITSWNKANQATLSNSVKLDDELKRYLTLKSKVTEDWLEEKISEEDYKLKTKYYDDQIDVIKFDKAENEKYIEDKQKIVDNAMEFITDPKLFWNQASLQVKKAVQELLFPSGIEYDFETGFGTIPKLKSSLLMEEISKNIGKNTSMVAVTGIEPVTSGL